MYETRLVGSGGKTGGLAGLGGGARGPLDVVLNGAVGLLLIYLAYTIVEPFWISAMEQSRGVKLDTDVKVLSEALGRYRLKNGPYQSEDLRALEPFAKIPKDPWGNPYRVDPLFHRILSAGEDGAFGEGYDDPASRDDRVFFYRPPLALKVLLEEGGETTPYRVSLDGAHQEPVGGDFPPGTRDLTEGPEGREWYVAAAAADGSLDVAAVNPATGEPPRWLATGPGRDAEPAIGPKGDWVYFTGVRDAPKPLVYRVAPAGGAAEAVTAVPDSFDVPFWQGDHAPAVSVAGHLAFHSRRLDEEVDRVCVVAAGRPGGRQVVLKAPLPPGTHPRWAADGKTLMYLSGDRKAIERIAFPPRGSVKSDAIRLTRPLRAFEFGPEGEFLAVVYAGDAGDELEVRALGRRGARVILRAPRIHAVSWVRALPGP